MKKTRIALVGAGGIAQVHAEVLSRISDVEITAVIDNDRDKAGKLAKSCGSKSCKNLKQCLDSIDAVGIYTPPASHKEIACLAMDHGKHVICEKPVASNEADAIAMKNSAEKNGVLLMTAFNMRFREGYGLLHQVHKDGRLGNPINYFVQRMGLGAGSFDGWKGYNWRTDPKLMCGMTTESLSHDIDMIRWHLGEIETVYAVAQYSIKELPGFDDNAYIVMKTKCGASVSIQASWSSFIPQNMRGIVGEKGTAIIKGPGIWDSNEFSIRTTDMDEVSVFELKNDTLDSQSYFLENQHFIKCIRKGGRPDTGIEEGLYTLRVSDAILKSSETNTVITL